MRYDEAAAMGYLMELLPIPGPPGDEQKVAGYIRAECEKLGVPAGAIHSDSTQEQSDYGGNTGNLAIKLDGRRGGPRRLLATHMDTVPLAVGCKPRVEGDRVVNDAEGRALGADARCGVAAMLHAIKQLQAMDGDHPPVTVLITVQEEVGLVGARRLDVSILGPELPVMGFEFDGGRTNEVVTRIIGTQRMNIHVTGKAAHGGSPQHGVSAAAIEAIALAELVENGWFGYVEKPDGNARTNLGILEGGKGSNVVMPSLYGLAECRSHSTPFRTKVIDAWKDAFRRAVDRVKNDKGQTGDVEFTPGPAYEPFELPGDARVVRTALAAARACEIEPELVSHDGGTDGNHFVAKGIPTVTIGIGGFQCHSPGEYADLAEFRNCCKLAVAAATVEA
ncbi:MAG: M20/M25/M40 family metallo-hydrolase [Planctomycetota bacterium]